MCLSITAHEALADELLAVHASKGSGVQLKNLMHAVLNCLTDVPLSLYAMKCIAADACYQSKPTAR